MSKFFGILGLVLAALLPAEVTVAAQEEAPCSAAHTHWVQTYELLKDAANALREAGAESIAPKIDQSLADGLRLSIAQKVQSVLRDRNRRISDAARKSSDAAERERSAFEQLRRCVAADSSRRSASNAALNAAARERNMLLANLQDLLLDEAYAQYKRESPNPPSTYSGYGPDQQSAQYQNQHPGPGRQMGYGAYAPYGYQ